MEEIDLASELLNRSLSPSTHYPLDGIYMHCSYADQRHIDY